ncbi:MAG: aromatic amino acid ammonia-lyase [Gammaproteobacteria bacterium]
MNTKTLLHRCFTPALAMLAGALWLAGPAAAAPSLTVLYQPIEPTMGDKTITLNGKDMTIEDVVDIARHGAKVRVANEVYENAEKKLNLVLEGHRQGVPIYGFNRGGGAGREVTTFEGDPYAEENARELVRKRYEGSRLVGVHTAGEQHSGAGPEMPEEEVVRALMAVTLNRMGYGAANRTKIDLLAGMLNKRVTPAILARGTDGLGDLAQDGAVRAAMVEVGDAYFRGERMSAAEALKKAGLTPLKPTVESMGVYGGGGGHNSYTTGQAALLAHDAKHMLDWSDLIYAMSMLGLNSSIAPLTVAHDVRPYPYSNWLARRLLNILRGSYLFELETDPDGPSDPLHRILQDPESFRTYAWRTGATWRAYDQLREDVLIEINSNANNPVLKVGTHPDDSWELSSSWIERYYVKPTAKTEGGYILGSSNFSNTPLADSMEQFVLALAQSHVAVGQRVQRFFDTFFTVITMEDLPEEQRGNSPLGDGFAMADLTAELNTLASPVPATGIWTEMGIQDVQGYGRLKAQRARQAVDTAMYLIANELLSATRWMDIRRVQSPGRSFGAAPTAAWKAWREISPWKADPKVREQMETWRIMLPYKFIKETPPARFLGEDAAGPDISR